MTTFQLKPSNDRVQTAQPLSTRPRIALIGVGAMGQEHIETALALNAATVQGLYDPHPPSIAAAQAKLPVPVREYRDLDELLADDAVDALIISTPNHTHRQLFEEVAAAGKHALVEKPLASTVEDAWAMLETAARHPHQVLQVGLEYRFKAVYARAIEDVVRQRAIGAVKCLQITEQRFAFLDKVEQWNKFSRFSGGTLIEKCCHYFDLFNLFAGVGATPTRVYASGAAAVNFRQWSYRGEKSDVMDQAFVSVDYDNGVRAGLNLCMFAPGEIREELTINGDRGRLRTLDHPYGDYELETCDGTASFCGKVSFSPAIATVGNHGGSTWFEHDAFVRAIVGSGSEPRGEKPSLADGYWSVVLGAAAELSAASGSIVEPQEMLKSAGIPAAGRKRTA